MSNNGDVIARAGTTVGTGYEVTDHILTEKEEDEFLLELTFQGQGELLRLEFQELAQPPKSVVHAQGHALDRRAREMTGV